MTLNVPRRLSTVLAAGLVILGGCAHTGSPDQPMENAPMLISRDVLFGNPDRVMARLSPDGTHLAYLAPDEGVLNVWVGPATDPDAASAVTSDRERGVRNYFWAHTNRHIIYLQDADGNENWRVHVVDLETGDTRDATPLEEVQARIEKVSRKFPGEILIGLNDQNPQLHDIYKLDLESGERTLVLKNPGFAGFIIDDDFNIRFAVRMTADGGKEILRRTTEEQWEPFITLGMTDALTTTIFGFDQSGTVAYLADSRERDTAALFSLDLGSGEKRLLAADERADLSDVLIHPTEKHVEAAAFTYAQKEWEIIDEAIAADFEVLRAVTKGDFEIVSRTLADDAWVVVYQVDDGAARYYYYDRAAQEAEFLFTNRTALEGKPLVAMHPVIITARDGLDLVSYLSLPAGTDADTDGRPARPQPMVLSVHGGPWARDEWGYNPYHQWLANRGYAVLSVNFRGSTGFGKSFLNEGNKAWGRSMHDDLVDAVAWAVAEGVADPDRVGIMGGSYGGYAALAALTFTPERFACAVDIVGPSNLITLLESIPPYWEPMRALFTTRVGDPATEEGRALLKERSPLTYADRIERPLLIAQGANDPRVKQAESDQIVQAMKAKEIPVTYVLYPDEGHGFARPENRLSFHAITEGFLAEHLGGRFEPIGDDFAQSSVTVPTGAQAVPGLKEALDQQKASAQ